MAVLVTLRGPDAGREFPLDATFSLVGRQPDATVWLESPAVSRQHAQLLVEGGTFFVEDLGSSNGTYVNGKRVLERTPVHETDTLQIGPYVFAVRPEPQTPLVAEDNLIIREQLAASATNQTLFHQNPTHKLQVVLEISQLLARTLEVGRLLDKLLGHLLRMFPQADRGLVVLCDGDKLVVRAQCCRGADDPTKYSYSRTIVRRALDEGVGILSEDARTDDRFAMSATLLSLNLRSLLCVPLISPDGKRLGVIQLDRTRAGTAFSSDDLQLLTAVGLQVAVVLENAALHAQLLQEERLRQELEMAREIQEGFLPTNFAPAGPNNYELFAHVYPAREVAGDLYDFFPLDDGRLAFFLGDVSGKGMPAALFMIAVRTLTRHLTPAQTSPAETLRQLDLALVADNPSAMFVTLVHGRYDPQSGEVVLTSAGHPAPLLRRADGRVEEVPVTNGRVLGYGIGDPGLTDARLTLGQGETLVLYTDGFTEAKAPDRQTMFGVDRLKEALGGPHVAEPLEACAEYVRQAAEAFTGSAEQQDDLTLLLLRRVDKRS